MCTVKKGFTLIELLVVISIMALIYTLIIPMIPTKVKPSLTHPKDLKTYLKALNYTEKIEIICTDTCKTCLLITPHEQIALQPFRETLVAYSYRNGFLEPTIFYPLPHMDPQTPICLRYAWDATTHLGDEIFISYGDRIYYLSPYFDDDLKFGSIQEAVDYYELHLATIKGFE